MGAPPFGEVSEYPSRMLVCTSSSSTSSPTHTGTNRSSKSSRMVLTGIRPRRGELPLTFSLAASKHAG